MKNDNNYIVYMHISPSEKVYVGITCQKTKARWKNGKGYKGCNHFNSAIKKYGWDSFRHIVLFEGLSKEDAESKEKEFIKLFDSTNTKKGYNIENGGNTKGKHSEETKRKIGDANRGKRHTEETKKILSEKHKGKKLSEEHRAKLAERLKQYRGWNKGIRTPDEVRRKIALANTGKTQSEDAKRKVAESKHKRVKCIETGEVFRSAKDANIKFHNKPYGSVYKACQNVGVSAYGYHWVYVDDGVNESEITFVKQPKKYSYNGETHNLSEWCKILNLDFALMCKRICSYHWDFERAITTPKRKFYDKKQG